MADIEEHWKISYRIEVRATDRIQSQGTGWLVSSNIVVTAFHVVGEQTAIAFYHEGLNDIQYILQAGGSEYTLTPLIFDNHADIAFLSLSESVPSLSILKLASVDRQAPGTLWRGQGFPKFRNNRPYTLEGRITSLQGWYVEDSMQLLVDQGTQTSWEGMSGSPIIDKLSNAVVGLITNMTDNTSTGWAATTMAIERLLNRYTSRAVESQNKGDPRSLYRLWLDISAQYTADTNNDSTRILHRLYEEWHGQNEEIETVVQWFLDNAWPDLLITIIAALENTTHVQLLKEAKGRLFGSQRLAIHLVWHPDCAEAEKLAKAIFTALSRPVDDPVVYGLGIPVLFWKKPDFSLLDLQLSQHSVVILLIDDKMVLSENWREAVCHLIQETSAEGNRHLLLPCALTTNAKNLDEQLAHRAFIDLWRYDEALQENILLIRVASRLGEVVAGVDNNKKAKARIFISYATSDGSLLEEQIRMCIAKFSLSFIDNIVDQSHAESGNRIEQFLDQIRDAVVVVLHTDAFGSRPWCKKEVLYAKEIGVPIVDVVALTKGESRSFPYLGNVRTILLSQIGSQKDASWPLLIIREALIEWLFHRVFHKQAQTLLAIGLIDDDTSISYRPPELLTIAKRESEPRITALLHSDPPLPDSEADVFKRLAKNLKLLTPRTLLIENFPRKSIRVALSISNPATLAKQGLDLLQLDDLWVALTRQLLLAGTQLAYGLDLRAGGYGEIMLKLLEQREDISRFKCDPARSLIAWPLYLTPEEKKSTNAWASLLNVVRRETIELPPLTLSVDRTAFLPPNSIENLYIWSRSLTYMRQKLMEQVDAVVAIGGKLSDYKGKYPGVVEEVKIALERCLPVFLVGGFGGCGKVLARAIKGLSANELTLDYQTREHGRRELIEYFNQEIEKEAKFDCDEEKIDYERLRAFFQRKGIRGLNNGLSMNENERLFITTSINEVVWLVLKGLSAIGKNDA